MMCQWLSRQSYNIASKWHHLHKLYISSHCWALMPPNWSSYVISVISESRFEACGAMTRPQSHLPILIKDLNEWWLWYHLKILFWVSKDYTLSLSTHPSPYQFSVRYGEVKIIINVFKIENSLHACMSCVQYYWGYNSFLLWRKLFISDSPSKSVRQYLRQE